MTPVSAKRSNLITVGRLTGVFGIKGWVKLKSYTEPEEQIFDYAPWWLKTRHGLKPMGLESYQRHGQGLIVRFEGIEDRDVAANFVQLDIAVEKDQLPALTAGEYYWHQLIGLQVISEFEGQVVDLGTVSKMLETGANDVLVVNASETSIDDRERLLPYVPGEFVLKVDLDQQEIRCHWDPDF